MSIYFPSPDDFLALIEQYFPCTVTVKGHTLYAIKPLTDELKFTLEMIGAPYIAEEDDVNEKHCTNNLHTLPEVLRLWEVVDNEKINERIQHYNAREKEHLEPKFIKAL